MPDIPGNDPDILALQKYARRLHARGLIDERILNTVRQALAPNGLQLPRTFVSTHDTTGLPGFRAIDLFAEPGTPVLAPVDCELIWPHFKTWNKKLAIGGWTCYLRATTNLWYFDTHFGTMMPRGKYVAGEVIGTVGKVPGTPPWWEAHIHHGRHVGPFSPAEV